MNIVSLEKKSSFSVSDRAMMLQLDSLSRWLVLVLDMSSEVSLSCKTGIDCTGVCISHLFPLDVHWVSLQTQTVHSSQCRTAPTWEQVSQLAQLYNCNEPMAGEKACLLHNCVLLYVLLYNFKYTSTGEEIITQKTIYYFHESRWESQNLLCTKSTWQYLGS